MFTSSETDECGVWNLATAAVDEPESRQEPIPAQAGCDFRHLVQNEDEDEDDDDFEEVEQRDWIVERLI